MTMKRLFAAVILSQEDKTDMSSSVKFETIEAKNWAYILGEGIKLNGTYKKN